MIYDEEHYNQVLAVARSYRNDVERLENQLAITEKAFELACQTLYDINFKLYNTEMDFKEYFKQQALTHQQDKEQKDD